MRFKTALLLFSPYVGLLFIVSIIFPLHSFAWGEKGTKWHYQCVIKGDSSKYRGTAVYSSIKDSIVLGKKVHCITRDVFGKALKKVYSGDTLFVHQKGDTISILDSNKIKFHTFMILKLKFEDTFRYSFYSYFSGSKQLSTLKFQVYNVSDSINSYKPFIYKGKFIPFIYAGLANYGFYQAFENVGFTRSFLGSSPYVKNNPHEELYIKCYNGVRIPTNNDYPQDSFCLNYYNDIEIEAQKSFSIANIKLFPLPVTNILNVSTEINLQNKEYRIIDFQGRILISQTFSSNSIEVSTLPQGLYLLEIEGRRLKFIKE